MNDTPKMPAETLEALKGSIRKWRGIVARKKEDDGIDNCPLCARFHHAFHSLEDDCAGCPVKKATGKPFCIDTPYEEWADNNGDKIPAKGRRGHTKMKKIAQAELSFLKSLLPEGEKA